MQGALVWSLVRELRAHVPWGTVKKFKKIKVRDHLPRCQLENRLHQTKVPHTLQGLHPWEGWPFIKHCLVTSRNWARNSSSHPNWRKKQIKERVKTYQQFHTLAHETSRVSRQFSKNMKQNRPGHTVSEHHLPPWMKTRNTSAPVSQMHLCPNALDWGHHNKRLQTWWLRILSQVWAAKGPK